MKVPRSRLLIVTIAIAAGACPYSWSQKDDTGLYIPKWNGSTFMNSLFYEMTAGGTVGLGTTSPTDKLTVAGRIGVGIVGSIAGQLSLYPNNGNSWFHID